MATVADLAGNTPTAPGTDVDAKLSTPNRSNAGSPVGSLTPAFPGELVLDTTNIQVWRGIGPTNQDWIPVVGVV